MLKSAIIKAVSAMTNSVQKIIHIDMDAFYAAIEIREAPELKKLPLVIGSDPRVSSRGVVSTCNYKAREYGIHSAMPSARALRLCPQAVFIRPRIHLYKQISKEIFEIFHEYSDSVEGLSLDEAYLDVSDNKKGLATARETAKNIKEDIYKRTGLSASAGVSHLKFVAKIASDYNKPNGLLVVPPAKVLDFIHPLAVKKIPGVGPVMQKKMKALKLNTIGDLYTKSENELSSQFGKMGKRLYYFSRGQDSRGVSSERIRKSLGKERTYGKDIHDLAEILEKLNTLSEKCLKLCEDKNLSPRTVTLKWRYSDFQTLSRSLTSIKPLDALAVKGFIKVEVRSLHDPRRPVRLLGISFSSFEKVKDDPQEEQLKFFS